MHKALIASLICVNEYLVHLTTTISIQLQGININVLAGHWGPLWQRLPNLLDTLYYEYHRTGNVDNCIHCVYNNVKFITIRLVKCALANDYILNKVPCRSRSTMKNDVSYHIRNLVVFHLRGQ